MYFLSLKGKAMKKINKLYLNALIDNLIKKISIWFGSRKVRIFIFLFLSLMWIAFSYFPYLNIVLTKGLIFFLILITLFFVLKLSWKIVLCVCIAFLFISYLLTLLGFLRGADLLGNYIYGFLVVVVIKFYSSI